MIAQPGFVTIQVDGLRGACHRDFNLRSHWKRICRELQTTTPFYALKSWRRVFRLPIDDGCIIYVKDIDETQHEKATWLPWGASNEAQRYCRFYDVVQRLGVNTARIMFALAERGKWGWKRSLIATQELTGFVPLPEYFDGQRTDAHEVLNGLCSLTRKLHDRGYYFSLDGHNIFIRAPFTGRDDDIALIDLDHMYRSWGGKLPARRRKRALRRFARTVSGTPGLSALELAAFEKAYYAPERK